MKQTMDVKKVCVDGGGKATVVLEFLLSDNEAKENVFEIISQ